MFHCLHRVNVESIPRASKLIFGYHFSTAWLVVLDAIAIAIEHIHYVLFLS